jgi:nucleotide-binding universal stress UspA family protein
MRGVNPSRRLLWGGITASVLNESNFPLLIIPSEAKYSPIKNILLTCDFLPVSAQNKFQFIKDLAFIFSAQVQVVHIKKPEAELVEVSERVESGRQIERALRGVKHSYSTLEEDDVIKGIEKSIESRKADLLVMVHRKKSFWKNLVSGSFTRKMSFHTHIPLLALPYVQK